MPVVVTISLPANGALLQVGANYQLVGTIQTSSPDGPTPIDDISAQGPGLGPVQLTAQGNGRFRFTAQGTTSATGIFPISVRAVDDRGVPGSRGITVSVGFMYSPVAPDILVDINPGDFMNGLFNALIRPKLQSGVTPLSRLLPAPLTLVGPEHLLRGTTERIGFWMLEPGRTNLTPPLFHVISANPPASLLPSLPSNAVVDSFRLLPTPTVSAPAGSNALGGPFGFGISVSVGALQKLVNALLPQVRAAAARAGATIDSITVTCTPPNMVVAVVRGTRSVAGFTLTITEVLGTVAGVGSPSGQMVPSITGTAQIDVGWPGWLVLLSGIAEVLGFAALFAVTGVVKGIAETGANNALGVANASISGIPQVISFKARPIQTPLGPLMFGGLFPAAIPSWTSLGVTAAGIVGTGTVTVRTRTVSDIALTLSGPTTLVQTDPGAVQAEYAVSWRGIVPDPSTFVLTVSRRRRVIETVVIPITNTGRSSLVIEFPMPKAPSASGEAFSLAVGATETSEGDGVTTLVAPPARLRVVIRARKGRRIDR